MDEKTAKGKLKSEDQIQEAIMEKIKEMDTKITDRMSEEFFDAVLAARCDVAVGKVLAHGFHSFFADMAGFVARKVPLDNAIRKAVREEVKTGLAERITKELDNNYTIRHELEEELPGAIKRAMKDDAFLNNLEKTITAKVSDFLDTEMNEMVKAALESVSNQLNGIQNRLDTLEEFRNEMQEIKFQWKDVKRDVDLLMRRT